MLLGKERKLIVTYIGLFLANFGFITFISWTPKFLISTYHVTNSSVVLVDAAFGVGLGVGAASILVAGALFDKIGGEKTAFIGGL